MSERFRNEGGKRKCSVCGYSLTGFVCNFCDLPVCPECWELHRFASDEPKVANSPANRESE